MNRRGTVHTGQAACASAPSDSPGDVRALALELYAVEERLEAIDTEARRHWNQLAADLRLSDEDKLLYESLRDGIKTCKRGHVREARAGRCWTCHDIANAAYFARKKAAA